MQNGPTELSGTYRNLMQYNFTFVSDYFLDLTLCLAGIIVFDMQTLISYHYDISGNITIVNTRV